MPDGGRRLSELGASAGGAVGMKLIYSPLLRSAQYSCPRQKGARGGVGSFSTRHYSSSTDSNFKSWSLDRFTSIFVEDSVCSKIISKRDFNDVKSLSEAIG